MKLTVKKLYISVLFLILVGTHCAKAQGDTLRVLFVGNSYTYFWNLPQTVEAMAKSQGIPLIARQSTAGGTNWRQHWDGEKGLDSKSIIEQSDWDIVVLQNHSKSTLDSIEQFMEYGSRLVELVRSTGAIPVLYQTWARAYNPLMIETVKNGYHELATREGVEVVPVGELWAEALRIRPELRLYDPDQSHPSTIGTYLTATAFFKYLTGEDPTKLDKRISSTDENEQRLYLSIMSKENAEFIQQLVSRKIQSRKEVAHEE